MPTLLVTGFGPYPGAPFNPTMHLAVRLARRRRPALADVRVVAHVFPTSYAAVDRDLPALIARVRPDALLMFGLAPRAKALRVETRARNTVSMLPDAGAKTIPAHAIAPSTPAALAMPAPIHRLRGALRIAHVPAALSHDAGSYLCNYLAWRGAEAARRPGNLRLAAFIHVPLVSRKPRKRAAKRSPTLADLTRAGEALLLALAAAATLR
jgi:pyroglutamyl-peptidase